MWFFDLAITLVGMAKEKRSKQEEAEEDALVDKIAEILRREVDETLGPEATYEQRRDVEAELMRRVCCRSSTSA